MREESGEGEGGVARPYSFTPLPHTHILTTSRGWQAVAATKSSSHVKYAVGVILSILEVGLIGTVATRKSPTNCCRCVEMPSNSSQFKRFSIEKIFSLLAYCT